MNTTEIPLKKVTVAQVVKAHYRGLRTKINGVNFIGTEYLFLKEVFATKGFKNRINKLSEIKEIKENTFEHLKDSDQYKCSDDGVKYQLLAKDSIIVLNTKIGDIGINYNYYSYFKKLGTELRFTSNTTPIGIFKDDEFIGVVLPIRIKKDFTY
ncbi:hypothetical protein CPAST_c40570 [Clostridium pasteurianum DSM 525 = ATCC 6013]|uniref:Uncharacterized protein n=1 Tax=Clostridium pasteurianum DSM 525 = ATCC 6013 TaxID=1262449 RepID=A0A0H3J854_CLOPA|nr:hypothetical protein [Clostridium pasteurianum]AJA50086.1 hypothetical protein CPAST_c40570 [Clostridium pasteurianum DSM 525 = ATCC 6013]AJA54074.1 hypothetical protein CLPA_c40570 [Clostridium pasteurianum DSM 525 = ATCC 6013]AOZ77204.1 hypothetical protein AQ983_19710 [Clostridium pasteurianum DSM 525 = ATCC 6013]AOZ81000.1 hypothetical protein AQ984_19705 [Clostridium pasteurianum]ELP59213.1 hypothetical protein F502_10033 [Clostridium pasteurianum DSM 525 = ATCC 6013]